MFVAVPVNPANLVFVEDGTVWLEDLQHRLKQVTLIRILYFAGREELFFLSHDTNVTKFPCEMALVCCNGEGFSHMNTSWRLETRQASCLEAGVCKEGMKKRSHNKISSMLFIILLLTQYTRTDQSIPKLRQQESK